MNTYPGNQYFPCNSDHVFQKIGKELGTLAPNIFALLTFYRAGSTLPDL